MQKFTVIVVIVSISLLNFVALNNCQQYNDARLVNLPLASSSGGKDANLLTEAMNQAEFSTAFASNKDVLAGENQLSGCRLVSIIHLLRHPGCQPKAISSFACSGSCTSYVKTSTSNFWQRERSCSCCQHSGSQEATFALDCPSLDPPYRKIKTRAPIDCLCRSCTDLSKEDIRPQELVEALASELNNGG